MQRGHTQQSHNNLLQKHNLVDGLLERGLGNLRLGVYQEKSWLLMMYCPWSNQRSNYARTDQSFNVLDELSWLDIRLEE
jgi:hypothetical protein